MKKTTNKAVENFEEKDLCSSENAYDASTIIYLIHLQEIFSCLKCVFIPDESFDSYVSRMESLNILSAYLNRPAIFICPQNIEVNCEDYFVGVIYQSQLLIINPEDGEYSEDYRSFLSELFEYSKKECIFRNRFLSENSVMRAFPLLKNSGALCVEIVRTLSNNSQMLISEFEKWSALAAKVDIESSEELYYDVETQDVLNSEILNGLDESNISERMKNIRVSHRFELESRPSVRLAHSENDQEPGIDEQNQFLIEIILNAPEQVLVEGISRGEITMEALEQNSNYILLKNQFKSEISSDDEHSSEDIGELISRCLGELIPDESSEINQVQEVKNTAAEEFSENELAKYTRAYKLSTLVHLVHLFPASGCLRYVFKSVEQDLFIKQLNQLNFLSNQFDTPAFFIAPELEGSGSEKKYFVGVIFKNQMLLINPLGEHISKKTAGVMSLICKKFKKLKTPDELSDHHIFNRLFVSTNIIQKDSEHLSSSASICAETLLILTSEHEKICAVFEEWGRLLPLKAKESECGSLLYCPVSFDETLLGNLMNIEVHDVVQEMEKIRAEHFKNLKEVPTELLMRKGVNSSSVEEQNKFIDDEVVNAPEQILVWELSQMEIPLKTPELSRVYASLQARFGVKVAQNTLSVKDQYVLESKILQMCESMILLCGFTKPIIGWFNNELLQYFHALYSIQTCVIRNELHPQAAFSVIEKERRCSILFELLVSKEYKLYETYTYAPALKEVYDFSDENERRAFLRTKILYKAVKRDMICFADLEEAKTLDDILTCDDNEILVHLVGYKEPGIQSELPCSFKSALEEFLQILIKFKNFNSLDFDIKLEGIQFTLNLARSLIYTLDDLRSIVKRDCFFISNKLPLLKEFESFGERYYYRLMSQLESNISNAQGTTIYVSQDGEYCVRDEAGGFYRDFFPEDIRKDIENLEEQLDDRNFTVRLLRVMSSRKHIRGPRLLEVVDGVNRLMCELDLWFNHDKIYEELRGVFFQHKVPNPNTTSESLLDRAELAFDYDSSLRTSINQWTEFHQVFCNMHLLKKAIDPRRVIEPQKLGIITKMESARSTLETFMGPIHNALFAEPNVNYRTCQSNLRHGSPVPHSSFYDLKMQKQLQRINSSQPRNASSPISPRSSPPGTPMSPRTQALPRPDSPRVASGQSPKRRTSSTPPPVSPRFSAAKTFVSTAFIPSPRSNDAEPSKDSKGNGGST